MIATSPGTPPPIETGGGGDDEAVVAEEEGNFTRLIGLNVLDLLGRDGVEELLTMCVTGLEGLGFNVTLCPLLEVIVEGTPVTFIFKMVNGWEDVGDGNLVVVVDGVVTSVALGVVLGVVVVVVELTRIELIV